jgi:hypothetical protein
MKPLRTLTPSAAHPLAAVAARHCEPHDISDRVGSVACGPCWRRAMDDDAAFALDCGLPATVPAHDPNLLDRIAIRYALMGRKVRLTHAEWDEAIRELRALRPGITSGQIAARLRNVQLPEALPAARSLAVAA